MFFFGQKSSYGQHLWLEKFSFIESSLLHPELTSWTTDKDHHRSSIVVYGICMQGGNLSSLCKRSRDFRNVSSLELSPKPYPTTWIYAFYQSFCTTKYPHANEWQEWQYTSDPVPASDTRVCAGSNRLLTSHPILMSFKMLEFSTHLQWRLAKIHSS